LEKGDGREAGLVGEGEDSEVGADGVADDDEDVVGVLGGGGDVMGGGDVQGSGVP
jgi:hypothetical protein